MSSAETGPPDSDDAALRAFVHRWAEAIVANDVQRMDSFVTDDWVLIDTPGVITYEQFRAVVASGELRHDTMDHHVVEVRRISAEVALLITHAQNTGWFRGAQISADEWTTDVLLRTPDGWRCTLTQLTPRQP